MIVEGVFATAVCYVQDLAQDSQAPILKRASPYHSVFENCLKTIRNETTLDTKFLGERTQHVVKAQNSLFETERRMRIVEINWKRS